MAAARSGSFMVQVGAFAIRKNAQERAAALRRDGFAPRTVVHRGLYKVWVGAYYGRALAQKEADRLRARGYAVVVIR
jgi:cell division protein FtsN